MTETKYSTGKTTIAPEVLVSIARLTALGIEGVSRLAILPLDVGPIFRNPEREGVRIEVIGNLVNVDVYVVIQRDFNVRDVARAIQSQVTRAISETVGMEVGRVNIHVEDIDYSESKS